jgi:protein-disulfide isomerase/uncharacterized membrane protein
VATDAARPSAVALSTLAGAGTALAALGVYQWFELLEARHGGKVACAINAVFNCTAVWDSPFAARIHDTLGMPVAALGIIYGVVAAVLPALAFWHLKKAGDGGAYLAGVKLWALAGLLGVLAFSVASYAAGAVCLTCLGTYVLTFVYAYAALRMLPGPWLPATDALVPGAAWALVLTVPVYLSLLGPGGQTPHANAATLQAPGVGDGATAGQGQGLEPGITQYFAALPERQKLEVAYARKQWLEAQPLDNSAFPVRNLRGPADAPLRVVDFTDILCGHCRIFEANLAQVERSVPAGTLAVEPRYYPLDGECNPDIQRVAGDGVRCLAAKAQICLEGKPAFAEVRHALFEQQQSLTTELIVQTVVAKAGWSEAALKACVESADTAARLRQDIEYARRYHIEGTPMVLINGRDAPPVPVFLLGMALARGDANAPFFKALPPAPATLE